MLPTIKQQQKIKTSIFFRPSYPVSTYHGGKRRKKRGGISKNNLPNLFARALSVGQVMLEVGTNNENKTRGLSHCGLAIYIKKYLKAREELWKLKYFTMQKYNLQKEPSKRNQNPWKYHNSITNLKFQHSSRSSDGATTKRTGALKFVLKYGRGAGGVGAGAAMARQPRGAELWSLPSSTAGGVGVGAAMERSFEVCPPIWQRS